MLEHQLQSLQSESTVLSTRLRLMQVNLPTSLLVMNQQKEKILELSLFCP